MQAPQPDDEALRLATLLRLAVLDTAPEERFDRYTRLAARLFGVPMAAVSLVDAERQWFKSSVGLDFAETRRADAFCAYTILDGDALVVPNTMEDPRFIDNVLVRPPPPIVGFYAGHPVRVAGHAIGTLCLMDHAPRQFSDDDRMALRDLAGMVEAEFSALAAATSDTLTGLSNRRGFDSLASAMLALCSRLGRPVTVLYVDLDGFKRINDTYGHTAGDEALRRMARALRDNFRASDVIARVGGDEFVVLCSSTPPAEVPQLLERLAAAVEASNRATPWTLAYSVGHLDYDPTRHPDVASLVADADAMMFQVKAARSG